MRVSLKICVFCGVFALLAGVFLSQAHAASDDPVVVTFGKQSVQTNPQPRIDIGDPGDDPHLETGAIRAAGRGITTDAQIAQDSRASWEHRSKRYAVLRQLLQLWLGQAF